LKKLFGLVTVFIFFTVSLAGSAMGHGDMAGEHHDVPSAEAPTIDLAVTEDAVGGFNVRIQTTNFIWAPENASQMHVDGEGHAHIYLDGEKLGRVYGEWYHLNTKSLGVREGVHTVMVDLNGNDHAPYAIEGTPIQAMVEINVSSSQAAEKNLPWGSLLVLLIAFAIVAAFIFNKNKASSKSAK
jgi:hypothetical protein